MKLRIRGNTVRLRLTQGEVNALASDGKVEESVPFAGRALVYAIVADEKGSALAASFDGARVQVSVPRAQARSWADSDQVGLEAEHQGIAILVEKDFKCLTPRKNEDDGDAFPNPKTACDC